MVETDVTCAHLTYKERFSIRREREDQRRRERKKQTIYFRETVLGLQSDVSFNLAESVYDKRIV